MAVSLLEFSQAINLQLFLGPGRSYYFEVLNRVIMIRIAIEADDGPDTAVNLRFIAVGGTLNLAALIAPFSGRQHASQFINLAEFLEDGFFHRALDDLHSRGA